MAIRLQDLLKQIPPETEKVVARTRTRFNTSVRQMLRQDTGLRLSIGKSDETEDQETHAVRVNLEAGVPAEMEHLTFADDKWLAILIAPWRAELESLQHSAEQIGCGLVKLLPNTKITTEGPFAGVDAKLLQCRDFAQHLLQISQSFDLVEKLLSIDDRVLGQYKWTIRSGQTSASINLYWGVIGLFARCTGVSVEGLTIKVLAHELAHAYTHLGADIDGHRWDSDDFERTERAVKEGLAQYYTRQLVKRLVDRMPEAGEAYAKLLPRQPADYQVQENWIKNGATQEHVRLAMMLFRRNHARTLEEFEIMLGHAMRELG